MEVKSDISTTNVGNQYISSSNDENLFVEYQWPLIKEGDFFVLEQHAISFLGMPSSCLKSFNGKKIY